MAVFSYVVNILLLLLGCAAMNAAAVTVVDDRGNTLQLDQPARRVVALAPHIVEIAYAVGRGDRLAGAVSYSNYPAPAQQLPRVGSYKNFSVESVLRLQPDLILAWYTGNGTEKVEKLQRLGIKVYWNDPTTLQGVSKSIADIGLLLGADDALETARVYDETLAQLQADYAGKAPVSVFYQVWDEPLQTLNGDHLISDVMSACGGVNVFAAASVLAPKVSVESILRANPQVIIASGMGEARPDWLDQWRHWPQLQAYQHRQLHFIPPELLQRHTPRVLEGAAMMCQQLEQARQAYAQP